MYVQINSFGMYISISIIYDRRVRTPQAYLVSTSYIPHVMQCDMIYNTYMIFEPDGCYRDLSRTPLPKVCTLAPAQDLDEARRAAATSFSQAQLAQAAGLLDQTDHSDHIQVKHHLGHWLICHWMDDLSLLGVSIEVLW